MKSFFVRTILCILGFSVLLVDAGPLSPWEHLGRRQVGGFHRKGTGKGNGAGKNSSAAAATGAGTQSSSTAAAGGKSTATSAAAKATSTSALNATVLDCQIIVPANPLTAAGLSTPYQLMPPCSMAVATQQSFAEAAIFDPATNQISVYHPLVINQGTTPGAAPVVPTIPAGATVGLWFGFNGGVLKLVDSNGADTNNSPLLKGSNCINGLAGVQNDVFGQVSWCNAQQFFAAANAGTITVPPLGTTSTGAICPTSRSFQIVDACPSDNVPTQYLLLPSGQTLQDTAANRAANPTATVINNASDEALVANILDPALGCTPFLGPSLDDPGAMVPALALSEIQAAAVQAAPIGIVPLNDPDCLLTASGTVSTSKTNEYRLGVNQPVVAAGNDSGALIPYCNSMISVAPSFFLSNQAKFLTVTSPAACVGNNLFTFMCMRYLMSLTQLTCPVAQEVQPVKCATDGNGVATSCTINLSATATGTATAAGKGGAGATTAASGSATATATGAGKGGKMIGMGRV